MNAGRVDFYFPAALHDDLAEKTVINQVLRLDFINNVVENRVIALVEIPGIHAVFRA